MSPGDVLRHNRRNNVSKEDLLKDQNTSRNGISIAQNQNMSRNGISQNRPEWNSVVDPSSGDTYYYNSRTGQTQWESPFVSSTPATQSLKNERSDEWQSVIDPSSGETYYFNKSTGKTQWEPPQGLGHANTTKPSSSHTKSSSPTKSSSSSKEKNLQATFEVKDRVMYTKRNCAATVIAVHRDDTEGLYYTIRTEEDSREIQTIEKYMSPLEDEQKPLEGKSKEDDEMELPQDVMEFVNVVQQYVLKQKDLKGGQPPKGYIESMVDVFLKAPPNGRETMLRDLRALVQEKGGNTNKKASPPPPSTVAASHKTDKQNADSSSPSAGGGLLAGDYSSSSSDDENE